MGVRLAHETDPLDGAELRHQVPVIGPGGPPGLGVAAAAGRRLAGQPDDEEVVAGVDPELHAG